LEMPEEIQQLVKARKLQLGVVPLLKRIANEREQIMLASDIAHRGYTVQEAKFLIDSYLKYREAEPEKPKEEVLEKAREIPLATCEWCKQEKPVTTFRQVAICDDCYKELIYLWVSAKKRESS